MNSRARWGMYEDGCLHSLSGICQLSIGLASFFLSVYAYMMPLIYEQI